MKIMVAPGKPVCICGCPWMRRGIRSANRFRPTVPSEELVSFAGELQKSFRLLVSYKSESFPGKDAVYRLASFSYCA